MTRVRRPTLSTVRALVHGGTAILVLLAIGAVLALAPGLDAGAFTHDPTGSFQVVLVLVGFLTIALATSVLGLTAVLAGVTR